jgi:hypothetical protein
MSAPRKGLQVLVVIPTTRKVGNHWVTGPVKLIRRHKPRTGGMTVGVFTNLDGEGVQRAQEFAAERGYEIVGMK